MKVGESYSNPVSGRVETVQERSRFENLGVCSRCCGIVEPPDEFGGAYTCCKCGLKFVVG